MRAPSRGAAALGALLAFVGRSDAWTEACLNCGPNGPLGRKAEPLALCPTADPPYYFVNLHTTDSGKTCPGTSCTPVLNAADCTRAATWLRLGMDGDPDSACPPEANVTEMWTPRFVRWIFGEEWHYTLKGCSWHPTAPKKLVFNMGDQANLANTNNISATAQASPLGMWSICQCDKVADFPDYVAVTAGNVCPDTVREVEHRNDLPTCGYLTSEAECESAAAALIPSPAGDNLLEVCVANCDGGGPKQYVRALNSVEIGPERPGGCHYRPNPGSIYEDELWFNENYNRSTLTSAAYARPPGTGATPDLLFCGCGPKVPHVVLPVNTTGLYGFGADGNEDKRWYHNCGMIDPDPKKLLSRMCGHGQKCEKALTGLNDYTCNCRYSKDSHGDPISETNGPAICAEEVPVKYIVSPYGKSCPYDPESQCLPPPTQARCEKAAKELGIVTDGTKATLNHGPGPHVEGCHFKPGNALGDRLHWSALGEEDGNATEADWHICECHQYPRYIPKVSGGGCDELLGCSDPSGGTRDSVCGMAADSIGLGSGNEATYLPGNWSPGVLQPKLSGCRWNASEAKQLWMNDAGSSDPNSFSEFRLCTCENLNMTHDVVAQLYGFRHVGPGDCVGQIVGACPPGRLPGDCIEVSPGVFQVRADRYNCTNVTEEKQCNIDRIDTRSEICKWNDVDSKCEWSDNSAIEEGEYTAKFDDCLETCLLLCNCTGVHFFHEDGRTFAELGGCDFFRGDIIASSGVGVFRSRKESGKFDCYEHVPNTPAPTGPPPNYKCPECNPLDITECRTTWGCRWSVTTEYCCCDPFVTGCTNSWHTNTSTKEQCEAVEDNGIQCKWLQNQTLQDLGAFPTVGRCELPLDDCVDEYITVNLTHPVPCGDIMSFLTNDLDFSLIQRPCYVGLVESQWCNTTTLGDGTTQVSMAFNLASTEGSKARVSCGRATRIAAAHNNKFAQALALAGGSMLPIGASCHLTGLEAKSKCWAECEQDPNCPMPPTVAPTPNQVTLPPRPSQNNPDPTDKPTRSPVREDCPPLGTSTGPGGGTVLCTSEIFDNETQPWRNRPYTYCGRTPKEFFNESCHYECTHCIDEPTLQLDLTCPAEWFTCEVFVLVYHEKGCANSTNPLHGGFLTDFPAQGWVENRCGPEFCDGVCHHNMVNLYKQVSGGDPVDFPAASEQPLMYMTVVLKRGYDCSGLGAGTCDGVGLCQWNGTHCNSDWCPKPASGPPPPGGGIGDQTPCCAPGTPEGNCSALPPTA